jgi:hypothetical protein
VVAPELGQECHRLLGALGDELVAQPAHRLAEHVALLLQIGRKQVAGREVGGEPAGVELRNQRVVARGLGNRADVERVAQDAHRLPVFEAHVARY